MNVINSARIRNKNITENLIVAAMEDKIQELFSGRRYVMGSA